MKILGFDSQVFLAPMAGITDYPLRRLTASFGSGILVSEMVAVNALQRKNPKTYRIADVRSEPYPVVVQLVGNDVGLFVEAAKLAEELGAYSLDINMGCPVKKIVNNGSGSALMKDMSKAAEIIRAVAKATPLKVSVKFRKGWDNNSVNAVEFARMCEDNGAAYITVHGRTRSEFYAGKADWDIIRQVKEAVHIPVIGNGDVTSAEKAAKMRKITGCDGVMIGRGVQGNPWIFRELAEYDRTGTIPPRPTQEEIRNMMLRHARMQLEFKGEYLGIREMRKHVAWYVKGMKGAAKFRAQINQVESYEELEELLKMLIK